MRHIKKPLNGGFLPKQGWVGGTHHFVDVNKMVAKMPVVTLLRKNVIRFDVKQPLKKCSQHRQKTLGAPMCDKKRRTYQNPQKSAVL